MGICTSAARAIRILLFQSLACLAVVSLESSAAEIPAQVREALEQNAAKMSPFTIQWKYQLVEKGLRAHLPKEVVDNSDSGALEEQQVDYKFKAGRYYFRREFSQRLRDINEKVSGESKRLYEEKSYDGQRIYMYSSTFVGKDPFAVGIFPKNTDNVLFDSYFERAGFRMPKFEKDDVSKSFVPEVLALVSDGEKLVTVEKTQLDERPCLRLVFETGSYIGWSGKARHEFYLDQESAYALRRHEVKRMDGTLLTRVELSDIQRAGGSDGPWLPMKCQASYYQYKSLPKTPSKTVIMEENYRVESCSLADIPDSDFTLGYLRPGMIVGDATLPGATKTKSGFISYTVPANPADLDRVIERSVGQQAPVGQGPTLSRTLLIGVNALLVVAIVLIYVWRRRQR